MIRVTIAGDKEWKAKLKRARPAMGKAMEKAVLEGLIDIEGGTKKNLDNKVLMRRSSSLFKSINYRFTARGMDSFGEVGTPIIYGKTHEFGATIKNGFGRGIKIKIPKRPFLGPVLDEFRERILDDIQRAIQGELDAT